MNTQTITVTIAHNETTNNSIDTLERTAAEVTEAKLCFIGQIFTKYSLDVKSRKVFSLHVCFLNVHV